MNRTARKATIRPTVRSAVLALGMAWAWLAAGTAPARAQLILGITTDSAVPGSATDSLDVTLTNQGSSAVNIAGFSFELNATGPNAGMLNFTDVTDVTIAAPYIFAGNSTFGPDITPSGSPGDYGQTIDASDLYSGADGSASVGGHQTVSLGKVLFTLSSTALSPINLTFTSYPATSLSGPGTTPSNISFTTAMNLSVDPGPASVPELPPGFLIATAMGLGAVVRSRRKCLVETLARFRPRRRQPS